MVLNQDFILDSSLKKTICMGFGNTFFIVFPNINIIFENKINKSVYDAKFSRSTFQMPCFYQFLSTFSLGGDRICIGQAKMGTKFSNTSFKQLIRGNLFQFVSYKNLFFLKFPLTNCTGPPIYINKERLFVILSF